MPFTETMTPKQRTMAALNRLPVDRAPVANPTNVATVELMDLVDAPFPQACQDPELAARLAATGYTELGFDSIMPYFSIIQESSALGCEMQWDAGHHWLDPPAQGRVRRRGGHHRQNHGAVDAGLSRLRC